MTITLKVSENTKEKMIEYFEDKKRHTHRFNSIKMPISARRYKTSAFQRRQNRAVLQVVEATEAQLFRNGI